MMKTFFLVIMLFLIVGSLLIISCNKKEVQTTPEDELGSFTSSKIAMLYNKYLSLYLEENNYSRTKSNNKSAKHL